MNTCLTLILLLPILSKYVQGHGHFFEPPARNHVPPFKTVRERNAQGCNVDWTFSYANKFQCTTVCGNFKGQGLPDVLEASNGPIVRTYTSGQWIDVTAEHIDHPATFRVKLCRLSSPTQIPTQECFDQNILKVIPVTQDGSVPKWQLDEYTVASSRYNATMQAIANTMPQRNPFVTQTIKAKLPDGLFCDHCVIQMETHNYPFGCMLRNGTLLAEHWYPKTAKPFTEYCPSQVYLGCSDVKILPPTTSQSQKVPVRNKRLDQLVIGCVSYHEMPKQKTIINPRNPPADAWGLMCLTLNYLNCLTGVNSCYNCIDPNKTCPDYCYCEWFNEKALKFPADV